ncbi:hypothetical protein ACGFMK_15925 [Amycolatopsis sp. NPDC049252]|uniref:hypothetical protein n=1 Tax=Amycolatopsis sp. NPDC049252 TaxID=3363933 RepID=UPI00371ED058
MDEVLTYRASLVSPTTNIHFWSNNCGVPVQEGVRVPVQRPAPALNAVQVRGPAQTPGLG